MKRILPLAILFCLLSVPVQSAAQTSATPGAERAILFAQIESLLAEIERLQALVKTQHDRVAGVSTSRLYASSYYDGPYEALYRVNGSALTPWRGTPHVRTRDSVIWALLRNVLGYREIERYIDEFRIYADEEARYDAFVEQKGDSDDWVFGVNAAYVNNVTHPSTARSAAELFIHEYAHILIHYYPDIGATFAEYWGRSDRAHAKDIRGVTDERDRRTQLNAYFAAHEDRFVSAYATLDPEEDFAESFTTFVLAGAPTERTLAAEKVRFFYQYDRLVEIRDGIRDRLRQYSWF